MICVDGFVINWVFTPGLPIFLLTYIDNVVAASRNYAQRHWETAGDRIISFVGLQIRAQWPFEQTPNLWIIGYLGRKRAKPLAYRLDKLILTELM
jgi:hypothetical protein